jgi:RNA polymerase sigma factor (sigma-70 family)
MPDHERRIHGDVAAAALCADVSDQMPDANLNEILFRCFVVPEIPLLLRVATSLTGQPADAEDLVQDTLIRVFGAIARFDGQHPRAWLLTILRHTHRNRARRRQPPLIDGSLADLAHAPAFGMPPPTPEQLLVDNTLDTGVARALGRLPAVSVASYPVLHCSSRGTTTVRYGSSVRVVLSLFTGKGAAGSSSQSCIQAM